MVSKNEKGQSTIEFIFTFVFGLSLILVIFNTSVNYATGYLVQYATFMASRVYLTQDTHKGQIGNIGPSLERAVQKAEVAFNNYNLTVLKIPSGNFKVNRVEQASGGNETLTIGAFTTFEITMDIIGRVAGQNKLELVSESFLGKEPTRAECASRVCFAVTGGENCDQSMDVTLYDDGC